MKRNYYRVGGHCFCVDAEEKILNQMKDYQPFKVDDTCSSDSLFTLTVRIGKDPKIDYVQDTFREDENLTVVNGHISEDTDIYIYQWNHKNLFWLICKEGHSKGELIMTGIEPIMSLDLALTILYRYNAIKLMTGVIHASSVTYMGKAYLFLGISGTGKSTHSRLWLKYFEGTELLNDDKPIIRIFENGEVRVYGSPWSGKTPCYRNNDYPFGGMVKLKQAPYNKIRRLGTVETYLVILHCIYGKRWDNKISDAIHKFEERLVSLAPMWHLECLPDEAAAVLCKNTITADN